MKVLLTGISGTIGSSILIALMRGDHEVTCLVRDPSKVVALTSPFGNRVSLVTLEQTNDIEDYYYNLAKGYQNIIHSGYYMSPADNDIETQVINGFVKAAKETSQSSKVTLIVTTGGLCVGESHELAGEDATSNANAIEMVRPRVLHEETVIASNSENLKASIVRPVCIYGGSFVDFYYKACKQQGKIVVPHGNGTLSYIHKDDLGEFYKLLLEHPESGYFNVSDGLGPNLDQVIELAKRVTGVEVVERTDNVWEHVHTYGFYLFELTMTFKLDSKRARELLGFVPKHTFLLDADRLLQLN